MSGVLPWFARPTVDLEPQMHVMQNLKGLKLTRARSQPIVMEYVTSFFSATFEARCFRNLSVVFYSCPVLLCVHAVYIMYHHYMSLRQ